MRYAGNFHPEWGYLSPAPSFVRTARVVLVAAAIGATTGAGVVFSLVGRADTETSVAARTLARPAETASAQPNLPQAVSVAPAIPASGGQDHTPRSIAADAPRAGAADSESKPSSTAMAPAGIAALAEVPAATGDAVNLGAASAGSAPSPVAAQPKPAPPSPLVAAPSSSPPAVAPTKAAVLPPAASASPTAPAPAEKKTAVANVKKRVPPRFASRGVSSRLTPGEYYMSADNYRENGTRGTYYRDNAWGGGGYYQSGGGRFHDW